MILIKSGEGTNRDLQKAQAQRELSPELIEEILAIDQKKDEIWKMILHKPLSILD